MSHPPFPNLECVCSSFSTQPLTLRPPIILQPPAPCAEGGEDAEGPGGLRLQEHARPLGVRVPQAGGGQGMTMIHLPVA